VRVRRGFEGVREVREVSQGVVVVVVVVIGGFMVR
jgi:hypothetical protein